MVAAVVRPPTLLALAVISVLAIAAPRPPRNAPAPGRAHPRPERHRVIHIGQAVIDHAGTVGCNRL